MINITENFLELVDIEDIILEEEYVNMVDISVDVDQSFLLSNGLVSHNSASSPFRDYRNDKTQGAFCLRGKFVNATDMTNAKLIENKEVLNFMAAMGLRLGEEADPEKLRYGKILIYTDADTDGSSIAALLINFLYKYWPELFNNEMVYRVETPIVVSQNIKSKKKINFYNQEEYNKWLVTANTKEWIIKYKKGLAALSNDEYEDIILNPRLISILNDESSQQSLNIWFGKDSELRKTELLKLQ
jgi:DNA gyrase/topoisomerase IV subunit B